MWNYRVIRFQDKDTEDVTYGLYETFYNDQGDICAHAERPEIVGETLQEIGDCLKMMQTDYNKHRRDPLLVLDGNNIQFAEMSDYDDVRKNNTIPFNLDNL